MHELRQDRPWSGGGRSIFASPGRSAHGAVGAHDPRCLSKSVVFRVDPRRRGPAATRATILRAGAGVADQRWTGPKTSRLCTRVNGSSATREGGATKKPCGRAGPPRASTAPSASTPFFARSAMPRALGDPRRSCVVAHGDASLRRVAHLRAVLPRWTVASRPRRAFEGATRCAGWRCTSGRLLRHLAHDVAEEQRSASPRSSTSAPRTAAFRLSASTLTCTIAHDRQGWRLGGGFPGLVKASTSCP